VVKSRRRKQFTYGARKGDAGIALIHRLMSQMGFRWQASGATEVGIDGHIELFDPGTGDALSAWLLAQSKARAAFPSETDQGFHFICSEADVTYWNRQPLPVILICSHPDTGEAWWRHVQEAFRDPQALRLRRVEFDKRRDRLDDSAATPLIQLAMTSAPRAWAPMAQRRERLVTNLLTVSGFRSHFYGAPTSARTPEQAITRLVAANCHGSDWVLHNKMVYSFRGTEDPLSPLKVLADDTAERFDTPEWSESKEPDVQRLFVRLLNGTTKDIYAGDLIWYPRGHYFFFRALDLDEDRRVATGHGSGRVVFTSRRAEGADGPFVVWYRHHALRCRFLHIDGGWCLALEPTYHFSFDGYHRCRKSGEWVRKMKILERNSAVRGTVTFWAKYLRQPEDDLLRAKDPRLSFGELLTLSVGSGIDERAWKQERGRHSNSDVDSDDGLGDDLRLFYEEEQ
jgi:hypothetical protein